MTKIYAADKHGYRLTVYNTQGGFIDAMAWSKKCLLPDQPGVTDYYGAVAHATDKLKLRVFAGRKAALAAHDGHLEDAYVVVASN